MFTQRSGIVILCSLVLAACGTNNVRTSASSVPIADPLNSPSAIAPRYVTYQQGKPTAQQYARQQSQDTSSQRQQWEQEQARKEHEAQQRYEAEKNRILRMKYNREYQAEQIRLAQQKLEAEREKQRQIRLQYQRKWETAQRRKELERQQQAKQHRMKLARQEWERKQAEQARKQQATTQAEARKRWQQQQTQVAHARRQQPQQRNPVQHVNLQPSNKVFRGSGQLTRLPDTVAGNLRTRGISERGMSVYVRPASGRGPAVLTSAADTPRNPASTMKLVTTYAALGVLGANYRWPTEIYTTGQVVQGTLRGDVIIKGYGNPDFKESDLRQLLQSLRNRGIVNIAGNLVTDISHFNVPYQHPGAFDGKAAASYNAQPEALLYQGRGSNYKFRNLAKRVKRSTRSMPSSPAARADMNTNLFGAFWKVWVGQLGGRMQGDLKKGFTPPQAHLVYRHHSQPLRVILREINKDSNNVMARQLLLSIGAKATGGPGTPRNGAAAIGRFLESRGLRFPELRIENGSGLSRISRISARHLGEILVDAYNSPWRNDYMNSLAVLGVDGTLRNRMKTSQARGRGRFKTGTLRNVRGLAGYVQARNGQTYVVSILHNDSKARSRARPAHDKLVEWVYSGPRVRYASSR